MLTQGGIFKNFLILLTITLMASCSGGGSGGNKANPKAPAAPGEGGDPVVDVSACEGSGGTVNPDTGECIAGGGVAEVCDPACGDGYSCVGGQCIVSNPGQPGLGKPCERSSECSDTEYCHAVRGCQPKCSVAADCGERETCHDGRCAAWAIDSFPGLADEIARQNDPEERMKEVKDMLADGVAENINGIHLGAGGCWSELDCKAVEDCVGETINGYCKGGFDKGKCKGRIFNEPTEYAVAFGFAGHCAADPNIGGVCNDRVPCEAGYSCTGKKAGAPRLSYCEKAELCPADKPLNDDGYCQKTWKEDVKRAARIGRLSYCGDVNNIRQVADETMAQNICSYFVHGEKELEECKDDYISEYNKTECPAIAADAVQGQGGQSRVDPLELSGQLVEPEIQSMDILVDTTSSYMSAATHTKLEFTFCPPDRNGNEMSKDYPTIFSGQCASREVNINIGATIAEHKQSTARLVLNSNNALDDFFFFKVKLKHDVVFIQPVDGVTPVPNVILHGLKLTLNMKDGTKMVYYQNPCIKRTLNNEVKAYFSRNDTAFCVTTKIADYEDAEGVDQMVFRSNLVDGGDDLRTFDPPLLGAYKTPEIGGAASSNNGSKAFITFGLPRGRDNLNRLYYLRGQTYVSGFTILDTDNLDDTFGIYTEHTNDTKGIGLQNIIVMKIKPGIVASHPGRNINNDCKIYDGKNALPNADALIGGRWNIYWLGNDSDYPNYKPYFPYAENSQSLNGLSADCMSMFNSMSSRLQ